MSDSAPQFPACSDCATGNHGACARPFCGCNTAGHTLGPAVAPMGEVLDAAVRAPRSELAQESDAVTDTGAPVTPQPGIETPNPLALVGPPPPLDPGAIAGALLDVLAPVLGDDTDPELDVATGIVGLPGNAAPPVAGQPAPQSEAAGSGTEDTPSADAPGSTLIMAQPRHASAHVSIWDGPRAGADGDTALDATVTEVPVDPVPDDQAIAELEAQFAETPAETVPEHTYAGTPEAPYACACGADPGSLNKLGSHLGITGDIDKMSALGSLTVPNVVAAQARARSEKAKADDIDPATVLPHGAPAEVEPTTPLTPVQEAVAPFIEPDPGETELPPVNPTPPGEYLPPTSMEWSRDGSPWSQVPTAGPLWSRFPIEHQAALYNGEVVDVETTLWRITGTTATVPAATDQLQVSPGTGEAMTEVDELPGLDVTVTVEDPPEGLLPDLGPSDEDDIPITITGDLAGAVEAAMVAAAEDGPEPTHGTMSDAELAEANAPDIGHQLTMQAAEATAAKARTPEGIADEVRKALAAYPGTAHLVEHLAVFRIVVVDGFEGWAREALFQNEPVPPPLADDLLEFFGFDPTPLDGPHAVPAAPGAHASSAGAQPSEQRSTSVLAPARPEAPTRVQIARITTDCRRCTDGIHPGDLIGNIAGLGWVHINHDGE